MCGGGGGGGKAGAPTWTRWVLDPVGAPISKYSNNDTAKKFWNTQYMFQTDPGGITTARDREQGETFFSAEQTSEAKQKWDFMNMGEKARVQAVYDTEAALAQQKAVEQNDALIAQGRDAEVRRGLQEAADAGANADQQAENRRRLLSQVYGTGGKSLLGG